jgi:hypothetical protein
MCQLRDHGQGALNRVVLLVRSRMACILLDGLLYNWLDNWLGAFEPSRFSLKDRVS